MALGLFIAASWHRDDRVLPAIFISLALILWDKRGLTIAAAVAMVTLLYHSQPAAELLGVFAYTFFFCAIAGLRSLRAAVVGFGFGAGAALLNLRWLVAEFDSRWSASVLLIVAAYAGIFMAALAALVRTPLVRRPGWSGVALTTLALPVLEYVRIGLPRFGIANLYSGDLPAANIDLAQAAHWAGASGLCALMAFSSYSAAAWLVNERRATWAHRISARRVSRRRLCLTLALILGILVAGRIDRSRVPAAPALRISIAMVQAGPSPSNRDSAARPYTASLEDCLRSGQLFDLIFLPEGAISIGEWNEPGETNGEQLLSLSELQDKFASMKNTFWVSGAMIRQRAGSRIGFRNTAISFAPDFQILGQVDKQFGAPLVEVNPFRGISVLEEIAGRATHLSRRMVPQNNTAVLPFGSHWRAVVAICSEHQIPDIWSRRGVRNLDSIDLQLVLSDLTWFDMSAEERDQSRLARRLLAAKYHRPLLYVASSGSEFWDQTGKLLETLPVHARFGIWRIAIPHRREPVFAGWTPPNEAWPVLAFAGFALYRWCRLRFKARSSKVQGSDLTLRR
jgi:apolipoprotein N-acyltransferase